MQNFKVGDCILVKDGISIDDFGVAKNWGGKITKAFPNNSIFTIQLDSQTLEQLPDSYFEKADENGENYYMYNFAKEDLLPSKRRDSDQQYKKITEKIEQLILELSGAEDPEQIFARIEKYAENYLKSDAFKDATEEEKSYADFVTANFNHYAYNYVGDQPAEWDSETVREVCLHYVPGKVSMEAEEFKEYGTTLANYFRYLQDEKIIDDASEIIKTVVKIAPEIPKMAADPRNWHMAKSMMMPGIQQGLDMSDQDQLDAFLKQQQARSLAQLGSSNFGNTYETVQPIKNTKKIGRNEKVTVKYTNGTVKKDVKYKKVMRDLDAGKCKLI